MLGSFWNNNQHLSRLMLTLLWPLWLFKLGQGWLTFLAWQLFKECAWILLKINRCVHINILGMMLTFLWPLQVFNLGQGLFTLLVQQLIKECFDHFETLQGCSLHQHIGRVLYWPFWPSNRSWSIYFVSVIIL